MLQLINALSQTADLYPDTIIPIERNNPLFNEDNQPFADITYGFKLPLTPNNQEYIKNAHLVEAATKEYAQESTLLVDATALHAGILTYKITGNDIDALLKINFGTIAKKIKTVKLSEIYTGDAWLLPYFVEDMKAACQYPKDYPYSFFPVYNDAWSGVDTEPVKIINDWDHATQTFNLARKVTCPYFKLKYLLQKAVECMGFQLDGDWLKDPESDEIFVYTQINSKTLLNGSFTYMPQDLTVHDFFVRIKERFGISCNFDMITGKVIVVTPKLALDTSQVQDISDYVTSIEEISVPEPKGYSILLKPDEGDELFLDPRAENEDTYAPTNRLIIGDQEKPIEMESSTLKVKSFQTYSMPATKQLLYPHTNRHKPFPLRFLRYKGLKDIGAGKVFPQAEPIELNADDALFYKFRNESKPVKLKINIPAFLLARLKVHQCIAFLSKEGTYTIALPEKISYNLSSGNTSYITATIQCRAMVTSYANDVQLIDFKPELENDTDDAGLIPTTYKAFFDQNRIPFVDIEIYTKSNRVNGLPSVRKERIQYSTDKFGTGGMVISPPLVTAPNWELRVLTATPVYAIVGGIKFNFTQAGAYWVLNMITLPRFPYDPQGVWIIFDDSLVSTGEPVTPPPPTTGGGGTVTPPVDPPTEPPTALKLKDAPYRIGFAKKEMSVSNPTYLGMWPAQATLAGSENKLKIGSIRTNAGGWDWAEADNFMSFAATHNLGVHFHGPAWYKDMPTFFRDLIGTANAFEAGKALVYAHYAAVAQRYPGQIVSIDGVNEQIDDDGNEILTDWYLLFGTQIFEVFIGAIKAAFPTVPVLITDFNYETGNMDRTNKTVEIIDRLAAQGIVVDGIGFQMHTHLGQNIDVIRDRFRFWDQRNMKVMMTELDVKTNIGGRGTIYTPEMALELANFYRDLFEAYEKAVRAVNRLGILMFAVSDREKESHLNVPTKLHHPMLFDDNFQPKLAYDAVIGRMNQPAEVHEIYQDFELGNIGSNSFNGSPTGGTSPKPWQMISTDPDAKAHVTLDGLSMAQTQVNVFNHVMVEGSSSDFDLRTRTGTVHDYDSRVLHLAFRFVDGNNMFSVQAFKSGSTDVWRLVKRKGGVDEVLHTSSVKPVWGQHLAVSALGQVLSYSIDGAVLGTVIDADFITAKMVGLKFKGYFEADKFSSVKYFMFDPK